MPDLTRELQAQERTLAHLKMRLDRAGRNAPHSLIEEIHRVEQSIADLRTRISSGQGRPAPGSVEGSSSDHTSPIKQSTARRLTSVFKVAGGLLALVGLIYLAVRLDLISGLQGVIFVQQVLRRK